MACQTRTRCAYTLPMSSETSHTAYPAEVYESFEGFIHQVIKETYERGAKRPEFVALVLASGELAQLAWGRVRQSGVREVAVGAAGYVALRYGLKFLLGGPLGVIFTGFTVAALVSFFWQNQKEVLERRAPYRKLISDARDKFDDIQDRYRDQRYDAGERALLVEGLIRRVLKDIEAPIPAAEPPAST